MNDREAVMIRVFEQDLPHTLRMMNAPTVVAEIVFGRDVTPDDDELPGEKVYDHYDAILTALVAEGVPTEGDAFGITIYALSPERQELLRERVERWLDRAAEKARDRVQDPTTPGASPSENEAELKAMNAFEATLEILRGGDAK